MIIGIVIGLGSMVFSAVSSHIAKKKAKRKQKKLEAEMDKQKGFNIAIDGEPIHLPLIYGTQKVGGVRTYHKALNNYQQSPDQAGFKYFRAKLGNWPTGGRWHSGSKNQTLAVQQAFCFGGIDGIIDVEVDGQDYDKKPMDHILALSLNGGIANETATNQGIPSTNKFTNTAWMHGTFWLNRDDPNYNGVPDVAAFVRGQRLWHLVNDDGVLALGQKTYSTNNAFVLMDYLLRPKLLGGVGLGNLTVDQWYADEVPDLSRINVQAFYRSSQICDTEAQMMTNVRGRVNGVKPVDRFVTNSSERHDGERVDGEVVYASAENEIWVWKQVASAEPKFGIFGRGIAGIIERVIDNAEFQPPSNMGDSIFGIIVGHLIGNGGFTRPSGWSKITNKRQVYLYECNMTIDTERSFRDNIELILETMGDAELIFSEGKYKLLLEYPTDETQQDEVIAATYDDSYIVSDDVDVSYPGAADRHNRITVKFMNEEQDFSTDSVSWPQYGDANHQKMLQEDNNVESSSEIFFPGCSTVAMAMAKAEHMVRESRMYIGDAKIDPSTAYSLNQKIIGLTFDRRAMVLETGDLFRLNSEMADIDGDVFKIETLEFTDKLNVKITAKQYSFTSGAYSDKDIAAADPRLVYDNLIPNVNDLQYEPSRRQGGPNDSNGYLHWIAPEDTDVHSYHIHTSADNVNWIKLGEASEEFFDVPAKYDDGEDRYFNVRVQESGLRMNEGVTIFVDNLQSINPIPIVEVTGVMGGVSLAWNYQSHDIVRRYNIYWSTSPNKPAKPNASTNEQFFTIEDLLHTIDTHIWIDVEGFNGTIGAMANPIITRAGAIEYGSLAANVKEDIDNAKDNAAQAAQDAIDAGLVADDVLSRHNALVGDFTGTIADLELQIGDIDFDMTDIDAAVLAAQLARDVSQTAAQNSIMAQGLAEAAQLASESAMGSSEGFSDASDAARIAAVQARNQAQNFASNADDSANASSGSASNASTSETNAGLSAQAADASSVNAGISEDNASGFASASSDSADAAGVSETNAGQSAGAANTSRQQAETAKGNAETAAQNAATSETNALGSENAAGISALAAATSENNAGDSADAASTSAQTATTKANAAGQSAGAANTSRQQAQTAKGQAETAASNAATSETNALGSENAAGISAGAAATSANNAGDSADAASTSAQTATTKANDASQSAGAATTAKNQAVTAKGQAETARNAAAQSRDDAAGSASTASTQAGNAATSAITAGQKATAASNSASTASTKANESSQSAVAANNSKNDAQTARGHAQTYANNAAISESNADGSAMSAASSVMGVKASLGASIPMILGEPHESWSEEYGDVAYPKPTTTWGTWLENDPDFGYAWESPTANSIIGPAYKIPFQYGRVYRLTATFKMSTDGQIRLGFSTNKDNGTTVLQSNIQGGIPSYTVADGVSTYTILIREAGPFESGDLVFDDTATYTSASQDATAIMPFLRAYSGVVILSSLQFEDVTSQASAGASADIALTAVNNMDGNLSALIAFRAKAGSAEAELELVAADNPTGPSNSIARISADQIILDGSVSAKQLVVTDLSGNIIPDRPWTQGDWIGWDGPNGIFDIVAKDPSHGHAARKTMPSTYALYDSGSSNGPIFSQWFEVKGEDRLAWGVQLAVAGGNRNRRIHWSIYYEDADGNSASRNRDAQHIVSTNYEYEETTGVYTVPEDAVRARVRIFNDGGTHNDGALYVADVSVRKQTDGSTLITPNSIYTEQLAAESITTEKLAADSVNVSKMLIDNRLELDAKRAGFVMGKSSAYNFSDDGIYMGRTEEPGGVTGFGLAVTKTAPSGLKQSLSATYENGLRITNANFYRDLDANPTEEIVLTNKTITLPAGSRSLHLELQGAGGAGGGGSNYEGVKGGNGGAGGFTRVVLKDGNTTKETWTASGGTGGGGGERPGGSSNYVGGGGESSAYGRGGGGGSEGSGGPATGQGAGGGGGGGLGRLFSGYGGGGGYAGQLISISNYDISNLANPNIVITIGAAGSPTSGPAGSGGKGSSGRVEAAFVEQKPFIADVITMEPTNWGNIGTTGPFPNLGAGFWTLSGNPSLNHTSINIGVGHPVAVNGQRSISFISSITPYVEAGGFGSTIQYNFHKMGP